MTADDRLKNLKGDSRRRFLKFASAVGAGMALERSEVLNVINDSAGTAMADEAACATTNRSISLVGGNGGFAWFQLLFPHKEVSQANNNNFAYHASAADSPLAGDTDRDIHFSPNTPWRDKTHRITAMMAGTNETHTAVPTSAANLDGTGMLAAIASIQAELPALLPVIGVEPFSFGTADGAPAVTRVDDPEGMIELFNSSASRSILAIEEDSAQYEAFYKAFLGLNRAAARPTMQGQMRITKASANFLGRNLANMLRPTQEDRTRYGIQGAPNNIEELGTGLIIATKAFRMGLTNAVILPALRDDPHQAFNDMNNLNNRVGRLQQMLDALMEDLEGTPDPACTNQNLADTTVLTIHGDTPKTPLNRSGWPDGTPGDCNWLYVLGAGYLKTGWFGEVRANNTAVGFDPATGENLPSQAADVTSAAAGAAALYAIAQGDMRRVERFYNGGSIDGLVNEVLL
ncbi:MAG: twin-arginine translocation signal domain-containing protein [Myxococcota bacterium]